MQIILSLRQKFDLLKLIPILSPSLYRKNGLKLPLCPQLVQEFQYQQ